MPEIRPFRALRYDRDVVGDLALVVAPPYDVISPERRAILAARDPHNIVALELPEEESGDEMQDRYRRAARALAGWRSAGVLRKDPRPAWYAYEQTYRAPGDGQERTQRGYLAIVRLVAFGTDGGILPHERTLDAPREDRYRLLRATGANTSPVVGLYQDPSGVAGATLRTIADRTPAVVVVDDDLVVHRMWTVDPDDPEIDELCAPAGRGPIFIADGHHRYETAVRYRDERHMTRSCEEDPAFDWVLMLLVSTAEPLTILPTHRVVHGLGADVAAGLPSLAAELFDVEQIDGAALAGGSAGLSGGGHLGLITASGAFRMTARRDAFTPYLPAGGQALRRLDVTLLAIALERLCGIDPAGIAGGRLSYTTSIAEAIADVDSGSADAAFILEPTPVDDVLAVARDGDVMPQKSTHFYPKVLSGLVLNPHEW
ncbi:MAG TPA: DUF1015 domain-containing protein [Candidatus Limnocylindrales bacterium]|nr:DUF1015 domain-containing protein [Candidatus Limnocylindrales bacterium]